MTQNVFFWKERTERTLHFNRKKDRNYFCHFVASETNRLINKNKFNFSLVDLKVEAVEMICERVCGGYFYVRVGNVTTCFMDKETVINASGVKIASKDNNVSRFYLFFNMKIQLLPIDITSSFPNLLAWRGGRCVLKEASHQNFQRLIGLKKFWFE